MEQGAGASFGEDLALCSPSQTPGQEPKGPGPAPLGCVCVCVCVACAAWALAQEGSGLGNFQDRAQPAWEEAGNEAAERTQV